MAESYVFDVKALIKELVSRLFVSVERLVFAVLAPATHFFAAVVDEGHIVGRIKLYVFDTPTGRKLIEHFFDVVRREFGDVSMHLG